MACRAYRHHDMGSLLEDDYVLVDGPGVQQQHDLPEVFKLPLCNGLDLFETTVEDLQHLFETGSLTSVQYTRYCLEMIRRVNPYLECVIETNPDALDIAAALDGERQHGRGRGPLHGIPVLVKDNMSTKDQMQTTAGSWALLGSSVPKDAHIVSLLRKVGAVIIGHTNLDEWAGMRSSIYSAGYSARGGQTRNPFDLTRGASGSSSGSAVAVSANIVPVSFGTETDTSVIWPAMTCGIVGIKPTVGLTSRAGVIPISETQDSVGSYGRTVSDAVRALDAIVGEDEDDRYTTQPHRVQEKSYTAFLVEKTALKCANFGLPMKRFWELAPQPQRKVVEQVLELLKEAGAQIIPVEMPCAEERIAQDGEWDWEHGSPSQSEFTVNAVECYDLFNTHLSKLTNTAIKTIDDIVAFNAANTGTEGANPGDHPAFPTGQDNFHKVIATEGIRDETYYAALRHMQHQCRDRGIDAALKPTFSTTTSSSCTEAKEKLDALLFCDIKGAGQQIAAQAGYPIITIPVGLDDEGMPVNLNFQHTAWEEKKLVKWASAVEDLLVFKRGGEGRATPGYRNHLAKNIPIEKTWKY